MPDQNFSSPITPAPIRLLDQVRTALRTKHYSIKTEESYIHWIKRYIFFHNKCHPSDMGAPHITAFLNHLAVQENVAASTQNQALSALVFLYRAVLQRKHEEFVGLIRAKRPERVPEVLSVGEVQRLLSCLTGTHRLMAELLYGAGLRLMEALRLRIKDVDFSRNIIAIRDGKGMKDRVTMLPEKIKVALGQHLHYVRRVFDEDQAKGEGGVVLPFALAKKYPGASRAWNWQFVFPSKQLSHDPRSGQVGRHHLHESISARRR